MDRGRGAGDVVSVGRTVELEVLDTPGHTMSHVCLLSRSDQPCLFSGDTLFNAGAGNCHNGGHPQQLYRTFAEQLAKLPETTRIYPGHDYIANNLRFTLDREPDNAAAAALLAEVDHQDAERALVTTLAQEQEVKTFFRLRRPGGIERLREGLHNTPEQPGTTGGGLKMRERSDRPEQRREVNERGRKECKRR